MNAAMRDHVRVCKGFAYVTFPSILKVYCPQLSLTVDFPFTLQFGPGLIPVSYCQLFRVLGLRCSSARYVYDSVISACSGLPGIRRAG